MAGNISLLNMKCVTFPYNSMYLLKVFNVYTCEVFYMYVFKGYLLYQEEEKLWIGSNGMCYSISNLIVNLFLKTCFMFSKNENYFHTSHFLLIHCQCVLYLKSVLISNLFSLNTVNIWSKLHKSHRPCMKKTTYFDFHVKICGKLSPYLCLSSQDLKTL